MARAAERLKKEFLDLLEKDLEFRCAVAYSNHVVMVGVESPRPWTCTAS